MLIHGLPTSFKAGWRNMKHSYPLSGLVFPLLFFALLSAKGFAKDKDQEQFPLTVVMGIGRGKYPGDYVTELRIGRMVYVSLDECHNAHVGMNQHYPARMHDKTIWVRVESVTCKYRVSDEHPFLKHTPGVEK